jgi:putative oxidoreductase
MAAQQASYATSVSSFKDRIAMITDVLGRLPLSVIQFLARLGVGAVFLKAGLTKIQSWQLTVQLFIDEYKVPLLPPELAARMAATFELTCAMLLLLGLFTRLATLPLFSMIVVIQLFVYPNAYAEHLTWGTLLLLLLTRGAGPLSLDRLFGLEPRRHPR